MITDGGGVGVGVVAGFKAAAYASLESPLKFIVSAISKKKMPSPTMDAACFVRGVRVDEVCFMTDFFLPWIAAIKGSVLTVYDPRYPLILSYMIVLFGVNHR
jgi:hypothetical protein